MHIYSRVPCRPPPGDLAKASRTAGPAPGTSGHKPEPESDTRLKLISVPADANVTYPRLSFPYLFLIFLKDQDPIYVLLQSICQVSESAQVGLLCVRTRL